MNTDKHGFENWTESRKQKIELFQLSQFPLFFDTNGTNSILAKALVTFALFGCVEHGAERRRVKLFVFLTKAFQVFQVQQVFFASAGPFAGDDVAQIGNAKPFHIERPGPGFGETGNAVRRKNQIQSQTARS